MTVLDHLRVKQVVGLGDGAGANIILRYDGLNITSPGLETFCFRFAMNHPGRVHGVLAINTDGVESAGYKELIIVSQGTI